MPTLVEQVKERLEARESNLAAYALKSVERGKELGEKFREQKEESPLEYRTEYHRDRDRIVWSKSFKRLQHKTQIFPHYVEDHYRRRLTHSLEVAQIATTVARALNLNEIATEAIALGHDLGHTPFGHAGETALNKILLYDYGELKSKAESLPIPLFGFDHCVHAIEVVSRIEQEYSSEKTGYQGLNLTFDVRDGILKHMFDRDALDPAKPLSYIPKIVQYPEYKDFGNNKGSLEAQCVYFADKVAYLLGDIEDGLRCRVLKYTELQEDTFLILLHEEYKHVRSIREDSKLMLKNFNDFLIFRRRALAILILECIENATNNINEKNIKSVSDVLNCPERLVWVPKSRSDSWKSFYDKWMYEYFFVDKDVIACSFKAKHIVQDLFKAYMEDVDLIKKTYRDECEASYKDLLDSNKDLLKLVLVRNYIAGMTDPFAIDQHTRLFMSSERVRLS